jgi:hypothetical protein
LPNLFSRSVRVRDLNRALAKQEAALAPVDNVSYLSEDFHLVLEPPQPNLLASS